jgi:hypothetical protein
LATFDEIVSARRDAAVRPVPALLMALAMLISVSRGYGGWLSA